ncbi:MAG: hypothetical protein KME32_10260 [Mojavia pulchra JT2-VF2]|jgi:hypothetical protein|uniref:Uncharacterized protein n=1 Tax=Mojavia pulchra JT2-VF2 TaxID=287848 RepID=A0A951PW99_9NOST|nr:hypothetical protein [Mojavia pulchra JT2-VF2]
MININNLQESTLWADMNDLEAAQIIGGYNGQPAFVQVPSGKPGGVVPASKVLGPEESILQIYTIEQSGPVTRYYPLD